jgi:hypothetical protein
MRVGIIAEGKADQAVISNILRGTLGIDQESIQLIRPSDSTDETDLRQQAPEQYGNCALVENDCLERTEIRKFFNSPVEEGQRLLVIHVDTAEIGRADAILKADRPPKSQQSEPSPKKTRKKGQSAANHPDAGSRAATSPPYADALRDNVIAEIDGWLEGEYKQQLRYAIAIEETEAWVLALFVSKDTLDHHDPKRVLDRFLNSPQGLSEKQRRRLFQLEEYDRFDELSRDFRRKKNVEAAAGRNRSLALFIASL